MALTSIQPKPPEALLALIQARDWRGLAARLDQGFPPNAAWPNKGSLFERFVMAATLPDRPLPGSTEHHQQMECLRAFLKAGLKAEPPIHGDPALSLPVTIASLMGRLDFLDALLEAGHSPNGEGEGKQSPLAVLASRRMAGPDNPINLSFALVRPCVRRLLRAGANVHQPAEGGWLPLQLATFSADLGLVDVLLEAGANPNGKAQGRSDEPGPCFSPMAWALYLDHVDLVEALLARGGNLATHGGLASETLVEMAGHRCGTDVWNRIVETLGWNHEDVRRGWFKAVESNATLVVTWFLAAGYDPRPLDPWGFSALDRATRGGALDVTRLLAELGLRADRVDPDGLTPLVRARRQWGEEVLREWGWKPRLSVVGGCAPGGAHGPA